MARFNLIIDEIFQAADGSHGGRVRCPANLHISAGQYLLAHAPTLPQALPVVLFATRQVDMLEIAPPLPPAWMPGLRLDVRGPLGRGFKLGALSRRVALAALNGLPDCLLPLIPLALAQGAGVALYSPFPPAGLPSAVEVLALEALPDSLAWADFIAADVNLAQLSTLTGRFGLPAGRRLPAEMQVLVHTAMPCGALAECGICAVPGRKGWLMACKDGPVFTLDELELT